MLLPRIPKNLPRHVLQLILNGDIEKDIRHCCEKRERSVEEDECGARPDLQLSRYYMIVVWKQITRAGMLPQLCFPPGRTELGERGGKRRTTHLPNFVFSRSHM